MAPRPVVPPLCRRPGCADPAAGGTPGFCVDCGLTYIQWRAFRDEIERGDLAAAGYGTDDLIDPVDEAGLDDLFRYLIPGPFHRR